MRYLFLIVFLIAYYGALAQPKSCDKLILLGDTTVCQDFKLNRLMREDFYWQGKRIFSRWYTYDGGGAYHWEQKISKGPFAKKNGPTVYYYPDGKVYYKTHYRHDKVVGPCAHYYPTGIVASTCQRHILKGQWDGLVNTYFPNGNISTKKLYKNGGLYSILAYRDEAGNEMPIGSFAEGNGDWVIRNNGEPVSVYTYKNGKMKRWKFIPRPEKE